MLFDRYRRVKRQEESETPVSRTSSLASAFFRKLPQAFARKAWLAAPTVEHTNVAPMPRPSVSLPTTYRQQAAITKPLPASSSSSPGRPFRRTTTAKRHSADLYTRSITRLQNHLPELTTTKPAKRAKSREGTRDIDTGAHKRHSCTFGHLTTDLNRLTLEELISDHQKMSRLPLPTPSVRLKVPLVSPPSDQTDCEPLPPPQFQYEPRKPMLRVQSAINLTTRPAAINTPTIPPPTTHSSQSIHPKDLAKTIEEAQLVVLIDVRSLPEFQQSRIRGSLNVNIPSLLVKRYQRGMASNFNLQKFITTSEGREHYAHLLQTPTTTSILEQKAAEAVSKNMDGPHASNAMWVVYDETMETPDQDSQAWTLLTVLERTMGQERVFYLKGGFKAFEMLGTPLLEVIDSTLGDMSHTDNNNNKQVLPRRSVSYTIGTTDKGPMNRRASLFTLDTQAAKANNAHALACRARKRDQKEGHHLPHPPATPSVSQPLLSLVNEDEEASPLTEADYEFAVSEIIPGFLYVGPEVETSEQAHQLERRNIRRILNMAEECHDKIGFGKKGIHYHKIATQDTVEMDNVERVIRDAIDVIETAKLYHEPIYVHCKAGKSRSVTAILAYLVATERWTLKQAYGHVIHARPNMSPNIGFITELMKLEGRVHGKVSSLESDWQSTCAPSMEIAYKVQQLQRTWQRGTPVNT